MSARVLPRAAFRPIPLPLLAALHILAVFAVLTGIGLASGVVGASASTKVPPQAPEFPVQSDAR